MLKNNKELGTRDKIDFKALFKYKIGSGLEFVVSEVETYRFSPFFSAHLACEYN